jgi:hypothetical protein
VQFRLLARIIGRICELEKWGFLYLTGDASLDHRNRVVKKFRKDGDIRVLIAGLKCGGIGLNLYWANRCISLDLWWNHAVEQQAFGRIFRIGQAKETYMTRVVVRNTVDMRLLAIQMNKLKMCERAMQDGEKKDKPALDLEDLARLFGFLEKDENGKIIGVVPDYDDNITGNDDSAEGGGSSMRASGGGNADGVGYGYQGAATGGYDSGMGLERDDDALMEF